MNQAILIKPIIEPMEVKVLTTSVCAIAASVAGLEWIEKTNLYLSFAIQIVALTTAVIGLMIMIHRGYKRFFKKGKK
jgi:hypothetical protein